MTKNAPLDGLVSPDLDGQARYALKVIPTVLDDGWFPQVANQYSRRIICYCQAITDR